MLLDEGRYLCSPRTMYRLLTSCSEVQERRRQLRHPAYRKPELLATAPNQVWSWDLTRLRGSAKWEGYWLYVLLDIFSRYVVGWMVAAAQSERLARALLGESAEKQGIEPGQLTVHADRGGIMRAKSVYQLYADLGIIPSHSRPYTSDDNPFSESQFKTIKYDPTYPQRFESQDHATQHFRVFIPWYNTEHRHSGIGFMTPEAMHYGFAPRLLDRRQAVLNLAYAEHPERFVLKFPTPPALPKAVWINPPSCASSEGPISTLNPFCDLSQTH